MLNPRYALHYLFVLRLTPVLMKSSSIRDVNDTAKPSQLSTLLLNCVALIVVRDVSTSTPTYEAQSDLGF